MAYDYYQQSGQHGWGNQFQFGPPPPPTFQPQASWGGNDFYRAHAANADPYLFDHAWNQVREHDPAGGMGVGLHEARYWHRRAYGAMNEVHLLAPKELGNAAAYEAYRNWIHNSSVYEPFSDDIERRREALTGLAVAEATRLLQFSSRSIDEYARIAATDAAAYTASYIFYQTRDEDHRSRPRYSTGGSEDPYLHDDELLYPRSRPLSRSGHRHRSHSRHRPHSRHGSHSMHSSYSQSSAMPFSGHQYAPSISHSGVPHSSYPGQLGSYGSYAGSQGSMSAGLHSAPYGTPMVSASAYGTPMAMGASPPFTSSMPPGIAGSYHGSGYPRNRSSSFSYPQAPYMGTAMSAPAIPMPMGTAMSTSGMPIGMPGAQTIVIHKPRKSKHRHHKRSRSSDGGEYRY